MWAWMVAELQQLALPYLWQALQHYASQATQSCYQQKAGSTFPLSCHQLWLTATSRTFSTVLPSQGTGSTLPSEHPTRGRGNFFSLIPSGLAYWYLPSPPPIRTRSSVFPRPGAVPLLLSAAACEGHEQLTCSHDPGANSPDCSWC